MGKLTINIYKLSFSIAMLNNQRVIIENSVAVGEDREHRDRRCPEMPRGQSWAGLSHAGGVPVR